jgi:hypothetical protein
MEYLSTVGWTVLFTVIMLVVYKFVINPQVVLKIDPTKMAKCPDGWSYNIVTKLCQPDSQTNCMVFDPDASSIQSAAAKCNLARSCGTSWSGLCG